MTATETRPVAVQAPGVPLPCAVGFVVCVCLAGFLDPGYSQRSEGISALASTESKAAGVMIVGFVLLALTALTSGTTLIQGRRKAAGILVVLAGVLTLVAGFARQSCSTLQPACLDRERAGQVTGAHVAHNLVSLGLFVLLVLAGFVLAWSLRRDRLFPWVLGAAVASPGFTVWFGSGAYGSNGGLVQRVFVALAFGLPLFVASRSRAPGAAGRRP